MNYFALLNAIAIIDAANLQTIYATNITAQSSQLWRISDYLRDQLPSAGKIAALDMQRLLSDVISESRTDARREFIAYMTPAK